MITINRWVVRSRRGTHVLVLGALLAVLAIGQENFVAIPPEQAAHYHIDFARNFFASPEAEKTDRNTLFTTLKTLEGLKGKVTSSAENLQRALELSDQVDIQFQRHYSYLYLRYAVDTADEANSVAAATLDAEVARRTAFLRQELMQIPDRTLVAFTARKPSLKQYLPAIETARRYRSYTLSLAEEELLSATAPNNDWPYELYERLRVGGRVAALANSADAKAREEAFKRGYAEQATKRDLCAFALMRLAANRTRLARLHHFPDAATEAYFNSYWTRAEVDTLVEQLAGKADLYKRYQRIRAEHVRSFVGVQDVNVWDLSLRPAGARAPRFTIGEASQVIRKALSPLGEEYGQELAALLDPSNGRMDIVPGNHRKRGGFSQGFIGTDSVFFSAGFGGSYNDVRVLAHESTHAVHRQLMSRHHVLPAYARGPHYLFEAFAIFSEFLLPDYLYRHETDPLLQQYYLEQFLEGKGTIMFIVAPEVAVEHAVYEGVTLGSIKGPDDLDALTKRTYSRFSIWAEKHDELKAQWMNIGLMYEDPFYDINYIYGALLALKFYESYTKNPEQFTQRYIALMRNGFDAPPEVLLQRFLQINLHDPKLVSDALSLVESKINLLEKSYQGR